MVGGFLIQKINVMLLAFWCKLLVAYYLSIHANLIAIHLQTKSKAANGVNKLNPRSGM
tara:strand:+ start:1446 stop:1619 length:174 start_codon:yes stop_codon:yes gene_type:complete